MADPKRKIDTVRSIENLQLSTALIIGLNDAKQAESIAEAILLTRLSRTMELKQVGCNSCNRALPYFDSNHLKP